MKIFVGCCGFPVSKKKYFKYFKVVEIQKTFYEIPKEKTLLKWKEDSPKDFVFTVKAFQGITHDIKSPTWRKFRKEIQGKKENYGNLQPTKEVFNSWKETLKAARILNCKIVLVQTPSKFKDTKENLKNAKKFFSKASRDIQIAFESRGWNDKNILRICKKFDLIHCVDPFTSNPLWFSKRKIAYFRLHGSPPGNKIYSYKYSKKDLIELKKRIKDLNAKEVFCFFNNIYMFDDALRFLKYLKNRKNIQSYYEN
jgi:uncharacterized protein YecE (DUF72 family)